MKWALIGFLFPLTLSAFPLLGIWKPYNYPEDFTIHVDKTSVYGNINTDPYIEMRIANCDDYIIELNNIQVLQRPSDWYNVKKYKPYIQIFKKIKQYGNRVLCNFSFLDQDILLIEPQIGEEKYQFQLCRVQHEK